MKKMYTIFRVLTNGTLADMNWSRYDKIEDAEAQAMDFDYDDELVVLPVFVPSKKLD